MIEGVQFNIDGSSEMKKTYKYDSNGNMIETTTYDFVTRMIEIMTNTEYMEYIDTFIPRSQTVLEISYRN